MNELYRDKAMNEIIFKMPELPKIKQYKSKRINRKKPSRIKTLSNKTNVNSLINGMLMNLYKSSFRKKQEKSPLSAGRGGKYYSKRSRNASFN